MTTIPTRSCAQAPLIQIPVPTAAQSGGSPERLGRDGRMSVRVLQQHQPHADLGPLSPWRADGATLWPETSRVQRVPGGGS